MYVSMYTHATDVFDEGAETVVANMQEMARVKTVAVCIRSFGERAQYSLGYTPHNPRRKTFVDESDVVYFHPDPRYYGKLLPEPSREFPGDVLETLSNLKQRRSFKLAVSFSALMNRRQALEAEYSIKDVFGGPIRKCTCINHPDIREYVLGLVGNLASEYDLDEFEFDHLRYDPVKFDCSDEFTNFLLQGCFCEHCVKKGQELGHDTDNMRRELQELFNRRDIPFDSTLFMVKEDPHECSHLFNASMLVRHDSFRDYFRMRMDFISEFAREAHAALKAVNPQIETAAYLQMTPHAWYFGQDHTALSRIFDRIKITNYSRPLERKRFEIATAKFLMTGNASLVSTHKLCPQQVFTEEEIESELVGCWEMGGLEGFSVYGYGWIPFPFMKRMGETVRKLEGRA